MAAAAADAWRRPRHDQGATDLLIPGLLLAWTGMAAAWMDTKPRNDGTKGEAEGTDAAHGAGDTARRLAAAPMACTKRQASTLLSRRSADCGKQVVATSPASTNAATPWQAPPSASSLTEAATAERVFTAAELARYTGQDGGPIYIAINGRVFDVSSNRDMYGAGGYNCFAGRDATVGLAMAMLDPAQWAGLTVADMTDEDRAAAASWEAFFAKKYPQVGTLAGAGTGAPAPAT